MPIDKISAATAGLPPLWMSRIISASGHVGNSEEIKKMLGEPIPKIADPSRVDPDIMAMFATGGMLERLRKKLALISRKRGGKLIPARGVIASVDENDNIYVGVEFLAQFGDNEDLVAAILAHEWGHMMSDLPRDIDLSKLTWERVFEIRKSEEADADGFAGRALYLMGNKPNAMMDFLRAMDKRRKEKRLPNHKYHNTPTRIEILKESYKAEERAMEVAKRLFFGSRETGPKIGRVISSG